MQCVGTPAIRCEDGHEDVAQHRQLQHASAASKRRCNETAGRASTRAIFHGSVSKDVVKAVNTHCSGDAKVRAGPEGGDEQLHLQAQRQQR